MDCRNVVTYKYTPQPQNKTNSCLLMKFMSTTIEAEGSLFCLFLKLVQINFIFTDNVRILYIYPAISTFAVHLSSFN